MTNSRRTFLKLTGAGLALSGLRPFEAHAEPARPEDVDFVAAGQASTLWYPSPATEAKIMEQALPVGNGRLGALTGGDPANDFLYLADASLWSGDANDALQDDGQFPYETTKFGTFSVLAKLRITIPAHAKFTGYRRQLDLSNGVVSASYTVNGTRFTREVYASHPDDVVIVRLGGGPQSGTITLEGTHGEKVADASFSAALPNGLKYAAVVSATGSGKVAVKGADVTFTDCRDLLIVFSGGTNYSADAAKGFRTAGDPLAIAKTKARTATAASASALLATHVKDYQSLYNRQTIDLGRSTRTQRELDSWSRIAVRYTSGQPDPELEASYLQFGRYLTITSSRDSLPINLQGLWLHTNNPDWMADYHTDINVQMNYWLADRAGLSPCFDAFADYCVSQLSSWSSVTQKLFNDPRNRFRNTSGKIAGWAVAFSTNTHGGLGWWWHPGGNAWLCNSLWQHYEFTQDRDYLRKIYPLLKGACEFWESRLITMTVRGREVLVDDNDWSPEHGPQDAKGITYAQEIVWDLFQSFRAATAALGVDAAYATTIKGLQDRLYLPEVSPKTGWLQEWMSQDNLGETTHRHLSPLVGFFPGDRIAADTSPPALLDGVRNLLIARGMESYGWSCSWRALCWARLKDADRAYQSVLNVMRPSINMGNGTAANFFDMYANGDHMLFQIDANLGAPSAMLEMLVYSRPGVIELLPALPGAWATGKVTGVGARGGFTVDVAWSGGKVTRATIRSVGGTKTEIRAGSWRRTVTLRAGESVTVTP
ncbi:glycoside hydrolase N-terminal domain-containing protein [Amycolatopsis sp. cg5]|uniref:glycosyl hydrolase family 95 catalytic domain-containing protein n=1 Tax=Amycolatopsis sp. cg5 TaxID=3238802 RepID=UPI003523528E